MNEKSKEELDALKNNWLKDPCWDIEDTEGFEGHFDELREFRLETEAKHKEDAKRVIERRAEDTGLSFESARFLRSFREIETTLWINKEINKENNNEIERAQVHATLLLAAQAKRIADVLESMDGRDSFRESVEIWSPE